jgi:hypothetical protein
MQSPVMLPVEQHWIRNGAFLSMRTAMQKHLMLNCLACLPELAFPFSSSFMELWLPQQTARHTVAVLHSGRPSLFQFQNEKSIEKARDPVVATNTLWH